MISKDGRKVPSNILILTIPQSAIDGYYGLRDLCSLKVSVTEYVRMDIPQCHRCQQFGHSSAMCNRAHRCVRCAGSHEGKPCTADGCKCANCGEGHPSSYRGCQTYLAAKARFLSTPNSNVQPATTPVAPRPSAPTPTPDPTTKTAPNYVPAPPPKTNPWTKQKPKPPTTKQTTQDETKTTQTKETQPDDDFSFKDIIDLIKSFNISNIIKLFKEMCLKLKKAKDTTDKIIIIFETLTQIF